MKKSGLLLLTVLGFSLLYCGQTVSAQSISDSLFNTVLYPIHDGNLLLIGTETKGSSRKAVMRLFDKNLKIIKEIKRKKARSYQIFLDEMLPFGFRVLDRYRWNKGNVLIFDKEMNMKSEVFFKRDDHKDWKITSDEPPAYPIKETPAKELNNILLLDTLCYFFDQNSLSIHISRYNFSFIKPVFLPVSSYDLGLPKETKIDYYAFRSYGGNKVIFYYSFMNEKRARENYFCFLHLDPSSGKLITGTINLRRPKNNDYVSEFVYNEKLNLLVTAGGYCSYKLNQQGKQVEFNTRGMDGWYCYAVKPDADFTSFTKMYTEERPNPELDSTKLIGYKVSAISFDGEYPDVFYQKFSIQLMDAASAGINSYKIYPEEMIYVRLRPDDGQKIRVFGYDFFTTEYKDKHWFSTGRTAFTLPEFQFNGKSDSPDNHSTVQYFNPDNGVVIYKDRLNNHFKTIIYTDKLTYEQIDKFGDEAQLFFYPEYYIKFKKREADYSIEKIMY